MCITAYCHYHPLHRRNLTLASSEIGCCVMLPFQSNEVKNSNAMDLERLKRSLRKLEDLALEIQSLATDRQIQIRTFLTEEKPDIKQWFDCWHIAKKSKQSVSISTHFLHPSPSVHSASCHSLYHITHNLSADIMCLYSLPLVLSLSYQSINMLYSHIIYHHCSHCLLKTAGE